MNQGGFVFETGAAGGEQLAAHLGPATSGTLEGPGVHATLNTRVYDSNVGQAEIDLRGLSFTCF